MKAFFLCLAFLYAAETDLQKQHQGHVDHLSFNERVAIQDGARKNWSYKDIADLLGRDPTTISREVEINSPGYFFYDAFSAQNLYEQRMRSLHREPQQ